MNSTKVVHSPFGSPRTHHRFFFPSDANGASRGHHWKPQGLAFAAGGGSARGAVPGWLDLNISEQRCGCGSNIMVVFLGIIFPSYRLCIIYESYQLFCMLGFEPRTWKHGLLMSCALLSWKVFGIKLLQNVQEFYREILNVEDYVADRRKELRKASGLDPKDSRVSWHFLVVEYHVNACSFALCRSNFSVLLWWVTPYHETQGCEVLLRRCEAPIAGKASTHPDQWTTGCLAQHGYNTWYLIISDITWYDYIGIYCNPVCQCMTA